MNVQEILDLYRDQTKDWAAPPLISDRQAIADLSEAQRQAARRARLLVDSTSDVAQIQVYANTPIVELSSKIISIRRARMQSSGRPLAWRSVRDMDDCAPGWDTDSLPSQSVILVTDYQTDAVFLYPMPKADDTLLLTVTREPIKAFSENNLSAKPELAERYQPALIEWMKFKAFSAQDTDLYDERKSADALARFEEEFGPAINAVNERFEFEQYHDIGER